MGSKIEWSKAGTRLRTTPTGPQYGYRNPDWNDTESRWKTAEEYAGETMGIPELVRRVACPRCGQGAGYPCWDSSDRPIPDSPHAERRVAAGAALIAEGWTL